MTPNRFTLLLPAAGVALLACGVSALVPLQNIDPERHGNLVAARQGVVQAFERLSDVQDDNDARLGGHVARAKDRLRQANEEIKLAAEAANRS